MKKLILPLTLCALSTFGHADEVALISLKVGKEKPLRQFALEFHEAEAPAHAENFKKLARQGFYKGLAVHRVFPNLLVQMGDPLSERKERTKVGTGGPGYTVQPEIRRKHVKGAIAAARLPDKINPSRVSNGSQFYVCLAPMPNLDGQYTVFGQIVWGLDTLGQLSTKPVDSNDYPIDRIVIKSVKVMPREALPSPPVAPAPGTKPAKKPWWKLLG